MQHDAKAHQCGNNQWIHYKINIVCNGFPNQTLNLKLLETRVNYIDIERIRFNDKIELEMDITGNIEDIEVPPLLFLTFIENAFKHGLNENDQIKISMSFELTKDNYLKFKLINNFNPKAEKDIKKGIGLINTKRRLKLLFANDFVLEAHIQGDIYNLFLKIPV